MSESVIEDTEISRIFINLSGDYELNDGRIGTIHSTPELYELNAFLGVLKGSVESSDSFTELFSRLGRKFRKQKGSVLEIRSRTDGKELTHSFSIVTQETLTYEETEDLLTQAGWSLDCWAPLEISSVSDPTSRASGDAAKLIIEHIQNTL